jgi:hypothetical protein
LLVDRLGEWIVVVSLIQRYAGRGELRSAEREMDRRC